MGQRELTYFHTLTSPSLLLYHLYFFLSYFIIFLFNTLHTFFLIFVPVRNASTTMEQREYLVFFVEIISQYSLMQTPG